MTNASRAAKSNSVPQSSVESHQQTRQRPPTSADVARRARVSRATVSFVLNDVPESRITDETRARVLAAAEELGYVPNASAIALAAGHSQLVLIPFFNFPSHGRVLTTFYDHLAGSLTDLGYTVMFHRDRASGGPSIAREWAALRPAGLIVEANRLDAEATEVLHKAGARVILPVDVAGPTSFGAKHLGVLVAQHLITTGHKRLAVVVPREPAFLQLGLSRLNTIEWGARTHDVPVERIDLALDEREAFVLAQRWRRSSHPTGVFAYNDEYAMMLVRALLDCGVEVPGDVAIVGCDNLPLCDFLRPRLTSIALPSEAAGRALADLFHDMMLGHPRQPTEPTATPPQLIIRESG